MTRIYKIHAKGLDTVAYCEIEVDSAYKYTLDYQYLMLEALRKEGCYGYVSSYQMLDPQTETVDKTKPMYRLSVVFNKVKSSDA